MPLVPCGSVSRDMPPSPEYTLKLSPRYRRLRLSIRSDASVVVTAPPRVPRVMIDNFIRDHADWIQERRIKIQKYNAHQILLKSSATEYQKKKATALHFVNVRLRELNAMYGFCYYRVAIKNQKSRWGSCSKKGNLNFNYQILALPSRVADYLMVHELCHLKELNHSKKFWSLVAKGVPDYRELKTELKKYRVVF